MWIWKLFEVLLGKRIKISTCMLIDIQEYKNNHVTCTVHTQTYRKGKMSIKLKKKYCQNI